jgi:hypothetical protein
MELKKSLMAFVLAFVVACVSVSVRVQADTYIKQKNHTDGYSMMGQNQPPKDDLFVTWMSKDKARMDHGKDTSMIIDLDKKILYTVNHAEMKYSEMPFSETSDFLTTAISGGDLSDEEKARAQQMMKGFAQMMTPKITVTETGETQKIKNRKCKKYIVTTEMMGQTSTSDVWATEDIKVDNELYTTLVYSMMPKTPGLEEMVQEMKKVKGFTVLSTGTTSVMGTDVKNTRELLEVSEKPAPAGIYEVPEGYKKE